MHEVNITDLFPRLSKHGRVSVDRNHDRNPRPEFGGQQTVSGTYIKRIPSAAVYLVNHNLVVMNVVIPSRPNVPSAHMRDGTARDRGSYLSANLYTYRER